MSRGPGVLQRQILEVLSQEPARRMEWDRIRRRFPEEVRQKNYYRAVRGLRRQGRIELTVEPGGCRYLRRVPPTFRDLVKDDQELKQLRVLFDLLGSMGEPSPAEAEASPEPPVENYGESTVGVDTYRPPAEKSGVTDYRRCPSSGR